MYLEVKKEFDEFIKETFREKRDVRNFLLRHERKDYCIKSLCQQIKGIEERRHSITFDLPKYRQTIKDVAKMFCQAALNVAERESLSSLEKDRLDRLARQDEITEEKIEDMKREGLIVDREAKTKLLEDDSEPPAGRAEAKAEEADKATGLILKP